MVFLSFKFIATLGTAINKKLQAKEAVWIARYWQAGASKKEFQDILSTIEKKHKCKIDPKLWVLVDEQSKFAVSKEVVAYKAATVDGSYLVVCKDLSVKWLKADDTKNEKKGKGP